MKGAFHVRPSRQVGVPFQLLPCISMLAGSPGGHRVVHWLLLPLLVIPCLWPHDFAGNTPQPVTSRGGPPTDPRSLRTHTLR